MKKILASLVLVYFTVGLHAQIQKGAVLLGGQFGYNRNTYLLSTATSPEAVSKSANFYLSAGKAIKENAVLGINVSYNPQNQNNLVAVGTTGATAVSNTKYKSYSAAVFYRQYKQLGGKVYFFAEGSAGFTGLHRTERILNSTSKTIYSEAGAQVSIVPGVSYNLFRKFQVEVFIPSLLALRYTHSSSDSNQFSASTGLSNTNLGTLGVGFRFIL